MKHFFSGVAVAYLVPLLAIFMVFLSIPGIRHNFNRSLVELPQYAYGLLMRKSVISRNFDQASIWLDRHLTTSRRFGKGNNTLLPGLIANTKFVVDRARLTNEFHDLAPFLKRLASAYPEVLSTQIWAARSLLELSTNEAITYLEKAVHLVPSDNRAYQLAVEALVKKGNIAEAKNWCRRYFKEQFGGWRPHNYNTLFEGNGIRNLALEIPSGEGGHTIVGNQGAKLNSVTNYDFSLPRSLNPPFIRLHFGFSPGIASKLSSINFFGSRGKTTRKSEELYIFPLNGYFVGNGWFLSNSIDGDTLKIIAKSGDFGSFDRVSLDMQIVRMGLNNISFCNIENFQ